MGQENASEKLAPNPYKPECHCAMCVTTSVDGPAYCHTCHRLMTQAEAYEKYQQWNEYVNANYGIDWHT